MSIRKQLLARLAAAARSRGLDADSPELVRFVEERLGEVLDEGADVYDRGEAGERSFAHLVRDLRRILRHQGGAGS